jgi:uncharacterized metal-binding protein
MNVNVFETVVTKNKYESIFKCSTYSSVTKSSKRTASKERKLFIGEYFAKI